MTDIPALQVDSCTSADFDRTLRTVLRSVTATHRKLLAHHYQAPGHAASTKELSAAMGWKGDSASLHYGGFAGLLEPFIQRPTALTSSTSLVNLISRRAVGYCGPR